MPVISSQSIVDVHAQANGGRYVIERHTDDAGFVHQVGPYLAPAGFNVAARVTARAAEMSVQMAEAEAAAVLGQD